MKSVSEQLFESGIGTLVWPGCTPKAHELHVKYEYERLWLELYSRENKKLSHHNMITLYPPPDCLSNGKVLTKEQYELAKKLATASVKKANDK